MELDKREQSDRYTKVVKNLLLNRLCDNCMFVNSYNGDARCGRNHVIEGYFLELPEENTCEEQTGSRW